MQEIQINLNGVPILSDNFEERIQPIIEKVMSVYETNRVDFLNNQDLAFGLYELMVNFNLATYPESERDEYRQKHIDFTGTGVSAKSFGLEALDGAPEGSAKGLMMVRLSDFTSPEDTESPETQPEVMEKAHSLILLADGVINPIEIFVSQGEEFEKNLDPSGNTLVIVIEEHRSGAVLSLMPNTEVLNYIKGYKEYQKGLEKK